MRACFRAILCAALIGPLGCSSGYQRTLEGYATAPEYRVVQRIAEARHAQADALGRIEETRAAAAAELTVRGRDDAAFDRVRRQADEAVWEMRRAAASVRDVAAPSDGEPTPGPSPDRVLAALEEAEAAAVRAMEALELVGGDPAALERAEAELARAAAALEASIAECDRFIAESGEAPAGP